jgi:hypothetical protein
MTDGWDFLTRPEFWFGAIICGLFVNILSNVITARFSRWVAAIGGWKGALDLGLCVYAVAIVLCGVGAAFARDDTGSLHGGLIVHIAPALVGGAPFAIVLMEKEIVPRFLLAVGAAIVVGSTLYILSTVPFPMTPSSKLFLFVSLNSLIAAAAAFSWMVSAALWLWRHDLKER